LSSMNHVGGQPVDPFQFVYGYGMFVGQLPERVAGLGSNKALLGRSVRCVPWSGRRFCWGQEVRTRADPWWRGFVSGDRPWSRRSAFRRFVTRSYRSRSAFVREPLFQLRQLIGQEHHTSIEFLHVRLHVVPLSFRRAA